MSSVPLIVIFSILTTVGEVHSGDAFFKSGWYRTKLKSPKMFVNNLQSFDNPAIFKTDYLRIMSNVSIENIPAGAIKNLITLQSLDMTMCNIQSLSAGAFENLPNLDKIQLQDNLIEHIPKGVFNNLLITGLSLQRNKISQIDSEAFDDMPNLYKVKLNYNKIKVWDSSWFRNSPSVTEVLLRRNFLKEVPENAFRNLKGSHVVDGKEVVDLKLFLSKNNISHVHPKALGDMVVLSQLWLDRNDLVQLDVGVFSKVEQIGGLLLSRNKLADVPKNMFPSLRVDLDVLDYRSNNLSCVPFEVISFVKITNIENNQFLDCQCVGELQKKLKAQKKPNEINSNCN